MKKSFLIFLFCTCSFTLLIAQADPAALADIRAKYAHANAPSTPLIKIVHPDIVYFLEKGHITFAKAKTDNGQYEFYFTSPQDAKPIQPYFIYFSSKNKGQMPDLRLYYNDSSLPFRFLKNQKNLIREGFNELEREDKLQAWEAYTLAQNAIHSFFNVYQEAAFPFPQKIEKIDKQVALINSMSLRKTDASIESEEPGEENHIYFEDIEGKLLLEISSVGSDHGFQEESTYYWKGEIVLTIDEQSSWTFTGDKMEVTYAYYDKDKLIKTLTYSLAGPGMTYDVKKREFGDLVPEVRYY